MTNISFCITTGGDNDEMIQKVIDSIVVQNIPNYEIIVAGGEKLNVKPNDRLKHIPFDESSRPKWTTRKKNLAVEASQYEVCIVTHDYISFHPDWYKEFEKFGTDWDICVHQSLNILGARADGWRHDGGDGLPWACMVPYDIKELVKKMCIQGNYSCVKRELYLKHPLNEDLLWGQAEDVEWSKRVVPISKIEINPNCIIQYLKSRPYDQRQATADLKQMEAYKSVFDTIRKNRADHSNV
jgi:hypothetical protein